MAITPVFNHNKTQLIIGAESTMGTAATLAASDNNIKWVPESISFEPEIEEFLNYYASGRHSQGQATLGKRKASFKCQAPLLLGASAGVAPMLGKALKACGQLETVVADTSVAYTPDATKDQGDNINITANLLFVPTSGNCIIATVKGCMGNFKIRMDQGGFPFLLDFDFMGAWVGITDGSALALTSPDTGYAPGTLGTTATMASIAQAFAKMELDAGNAIEIDEDNSDPTGYGASYIASRKPTMSYDPKARLLAVDPVYTRLIANTEQAFSMATATENSMKYTLSAPKWQASGMKFAKRGSELTWDQSGHLNENAGNDAHQLLQSA
jgi:hypothetical protein